MGTIDAMRGALNLIARRKAPPSPAYEKGFYGIQVDFPGYPYIANWDYLNDPIVRQDFNKIFERYEEAGVWCYDHCQGPHVSSIARCEFDSSGQPIFSPLGRDNIFFAFEREEELFLFSLCWNTK